MGALHLGPCSPACTGQYVSVEPVLSTLGWADQVIRTGDKLYLKQLNAGPTGGLELAFSDGSWAFGSNLQDGSGVNVDGDAQQNAWHDRTFSLNNFNGKTLSRFILLSFASNSASAQDMYFRDVAIVSSDGTVRPVYNGQKTLSWTGPFGSAPGKSVWNACHPTFPAPKAGFSASK